MALRQEDLRAGVRAEVIAFPTAVVRRRAAADMRVVFLKRRLTALSAALVLAAGLGVVAGSSAPVKVSPEAPKSVRIQAGDTIWGLASVYAPHADPRAFVDEVLRLNNLSGPPAVGTKVRLPRG